MFKGTYALIGGRKLGGRRKCTSTYISLEKHNKLNTNLIWVVF